MKPKLIQLLQFILIIAVIAGMIWGFNQIGAEQLKSNVQQFGIWAPLVLMGLRFTSIVIPILPGTVFAFLAGGLFGFGVGAATILIADALACTLNFYLARRYGRSLVQKFVGERFMDRVDQLSRKHLEKNFFLTTGFMMGGGFDFVTYGIGLTQMKWNRFLSALGISLVLAKPPIVALGAGIFDGGQTVVIVAVVACFSLAIANAIFNQKNRDVAD
jgi:uncharacterized membrane protein YdjX (TVP38/TMEM64 family)